MSQHFNTCLQKGKVKIKILGILFTLLVLFFGTMIFLNFYQKDSISQGEIVMVERQSTDEFNKTEKLLRVDIDEDKRFEEIIFKEKGETPALSEVEVFFKKDQEEKFIYKIGGYFNKAWIIDFENDGQKEVILENITGQIGSTTIFYYKDKTLNIAEDIFEGWESLFDESGIYFIDEDQDKKIDKIVIYNFDKPSDCLSNSAEIYQYHQGKLIKFMEAKVDPRWCQLRDESKGI